MQLQYRGIPYPVRSSIVQDHDVESGAIALTYRGASYLVRSSAIATQSNLDLSSVTLRYRGAFYKHP